MLVYAVVISLFICGSTFKVPGRVPVWRNAVRSGSVEMMATASSGWERGRWVSQLSTNPTLSNAIDEVVTSLAVRADQAALDGHGFDLAIFFVNSVYDYQSVDYSTIHAAIRQAVPSVTHIMGCTTGGVVGPLDTHKAMEATEVEARAGLTITLGCVGEDVKIRPVRLEPEDIDAYVADGQRTVLGGHILGHGEGEGGVTMLLSSEAAKANLSRVAGTMNRREKHKVFGGVASSVTTLHMPKVFITSEKDEGETLFKFNTGLVGLSFSGNIDVHTVMARSCQPVGAVYHIASATGTDILSLIPVVGSTPALASAGGIPELAESTPAAPVGVVEGTQPLVQLDRVITALEIQDRDSANALKRELLVGIAPGEISKTDEQNLLLREDFCSQRPTTFDPFSGSVSVPALPTDAHGKASFQFCVRDSAVARADLKRAQSALSTHMKDKVSSGLIPKAAFLIGSMERGARVFRFSSFESGHMTSSLQEAGCTDVPVVGMYSYGSFANRDGDPPLMEMDSVWAVLTTKVPEQEQEQVQEEVKNDDSTPIIGNTNPVSTLSGIEDYFSDVDRRTPAYDDSGDLVIVTKRDPESAPPVRVASLDYVVPEKTPQPSNVLESLVWDREKDVDRLRERIPMARAMMLARAADAKFPRRDFIEAIRGAQEKMELLNARSPTPVTLVALLRSSLHNGNNVFMTLGTDEEAEAAEKLLSPEQAYMGLGAAAAQKNALAGVAAEALAAGAIVLGTSVDSGVPRGSYEDLETLKLTTSVPVIADDLVVYGYQILKAKSSGADAIKLLASVLTTTEIEYNIKVARAVGITCMVVVSTAPQAQAVLDEVPSLQVLLVSSRNHRVWKVTLPLTLTLIVSPSLTLS
mgnify:CR=1 FL=1